jgi:hypothetical protein
MPEQNKSQAAVIVFVVDQKTGSIDSVRTSDGNCPVIVGMTDANAIAELKKITSRHGVSSTDAYHQTDDTYYEDGRYRVYTFTWTNKLSF